VQRYRRNFESTVSGADLVLCGNLELARRLPHDRYEIVPTPIDTERFRPGAVEDGSGALALGWVGHSDNLPYLESLAGAFRELTRRHPGLRLIVVADRAPRIDGVEVEFRRWSLESELTCFAGITVGLMPLADTPWTRGKCAFKAIQYMALGIPAVASPVGMNREVIRNGECGFLPEGEEQWVDVLDRLLGNRALAATIGEAGRVRVEEEYSLRAVSGRVVEAMRGLAVSRV
jgi:glycosyltransferase involved in cell wall biosynthesis